jgi:NitT/TauT family transport system substrate-binding protein
MRKSLKICCLTILIGILGVVGPAAAEDALQPLTVQLSWRTNVQFAGILTANAHGWYAEAGIELTVKERVEDLDVIEEVLAGNADIGIATGGAEVIRARVAGHPIKAIATQFQKAPLCFVSKQARGIETPEDLRGQRIGLKTGSAELALRIILADQGIGYDEVTVVKIGWGLDPLLNEEVDAMQAYMNNEPLVLQNMGQAVNYIPAFKYGYDFYSGVYTTTDALIAEQPELLQTFLDITLRGWKEAFQTPDEAAQRIVDRYYPDGDVAHQTESLKLFRMLATIGDGQKFLGWMNADTWQNGIDKLHEFQHIEQSVAAETIFTPQFLERIYFSK